MSGRPPWAAPPMSWAANCATSTPARRPTIRSRTPRSLSTATRRKRIPPLCGGTADGGVLLLDETLRQSHEGGILFRRVAVDNDLGVLLRIVGLLAGVEVAQFAAQDIGGAAHGGLPDIEAHERLLQLEVVELHARVFVERVVPLAQTVGGL